MKFRPHKQHLLQLLPASLIQTRGSDDSRACYLTFDDGPEPDVTPRLLDLLAEHGMKASFFLIGEKVERHPALVERIVAEGHMIGNHTYTHRRFRSLSLQQQLAEIQRTDELLRAFDGLPQHRVRTPQGYLAPSLLLHFALHRRSIVYWSYDSHDYRKPDHDDLVAQLRAHPPKAGDIVLMHDDYRHAVDALRVVLPEWMKAELAFRALEPVVAS